MKIAWRVLVTMWVVGPFTAVCAQEPPSLEPYSNDLCARALPLSEERAKLELRQQTGTDLATSYYENLARKRFIPPHAFRSRVDGSLYPLALAMPDTGETLVIEHPRRSDLPSRRLWLFDDRGGKTEVELPAELRAPPFIDDPLVKYDWNAIYYPWSSRRMFLLYTTKGLYGLRGGKISLISAASRLPDNHTFDLGGGFHDLGPDVDAIVFGSPHGPTPYITINEQKGVVRSEVLPEMRNGAPGEPHPDGKSLIVFAKGRAYRVPTDAPATELLPPAYGAKFGAFAGTSIPWWPGTLLNTYAGFKLLTPSGAILRIRGMEGLDARRTYITFGESTKRVYYWTAPWLEPFGEIVTLDPGETCPNEAGREAWTPFPAP